MDPLQRSRIKGDLEDSLVESRLSNVRRRKPMALVRRGLEETDDDVPRPVSGRGTNEEIENKVSADQISTSVGGRPSSTAPLPMDSFYAKRRPVLGQDVSGVDEESLMSGITMDPAIRCIEGGASGESHLSTKTNDSNAVTNDAHDLNNQVSNEIPNGLNGTAASEELDGNVEYAIRKRWLRVAVPLLMTPFSVGGIFLCLLSFGPCSFSTCNIQRSRAVIGSIMVFIPQALVQLIVLTTREKQWGYWCSFTASFMFEGAGLLISLLVALSTPTVDVFADWVLAVSVQSFSWYFTTWAICVRAKKLTTGRKTRESDIFLNHKDNGDCLGLIAAYLMYIANTAGSRAAATRAADSTNTAADVASFIFFAVGSSVTGILSCCLCRACCEHIGAKDCCCVRDNGKRGAPCAERLIWYLSPLLLVEFPALLRAGSREGAGMVFAYSLMMIYSLGSLVADCGMWSFFSQEFAERRRNPLDSDVIDEEVGDSSIVGKSYTKIEVLTLPTGRLGVYFKGNKRSPAKVSRFESFSPLVEVLEIGKEVVSLYIPGAELHTNINSVRLGKLLADSSHIANRELTVCCESTKDEDSKEIEARNDEKEYEKKDTKLETVTLPPGRLGIYFVGTKKSGVKVSRVESSSPLVGALGEGTEVVSLYVPGDKLYSNVGSLRLGKALSESSTVVNRKLKVRKRYDEPFALIQEESPSDADGGDSDFSC